MFGLDDRLAHAGTGGGIGLALLVAVLLGLRHASDPDHLTAVSTLVMTDERRGARRAGTLGLAWGLGHATTLVLFGLPVVLLGSELPGAVQRAAEAAIGVVIVALAVRLILRWRRGYFHEHPHAHGERRHSHPHAHRHEDEHARAAHEHPHPEALGRSPAAAFAIGLVHGIGGSAAVGVLLVSAIPGRGAAVGALVLFAAATAVSMALLSTTLGRALVRGPVARRLVRAAPALGFASLAFGAWYALAGVGALPAGLG